MNRYRLSQQAEQDLEDIWVYLAQNDEVAADLQVASILDKFPMLAQFPNMGKKQDELRAGLRSFPVKPYLIFYKQSSINKPLSILKLSVSFTNLETSIGTSKNKKISSLEGGRISG